jgi:hypothetical protein
MESRIVTSGFPDPNYNSSYTPLYDQYVPSVETIEEGDLNENEEEETLEDFEIDAAIKPFIELPTKEDFEA